MMEWCKPIHPVLALWLRRSPWKKTLRVRHGPWHFLWGFEDFFQHRRLTRIFKDWIEGVSDEIEKRLQVGIPKFFGGLFGAVGEIDEKRQDFIGSDGVQFPVTEPGPERNSHELIILQRIFFRAGGMILDERTDSY